MTTSVKIGLIAFLLCQYQVLAMITATENREHLWPTFIGGEIGSVLFSAIVWLTVSLFVR